MSTLTRTAAKYKGDRELQGNLQTNLSTLVRKVGKSVALAAIMLAPTATAQAFKDVIKPDSSLVLQDRGSFYVGGDKVKQTFVENGSVYIPENDTIIINQMYVEYMIPDSEVNIPVVMLHGATLSGKTYDTTPDGRMGWYEYFVRQGYPTYIPDQVSRARSGFDQRVFNNVGAEVRPPSDQPTIRRRGEGNAWVQFRIGSTLGTAFPDTKFPVEAADEFLKQGIPEFNTGLPEHNPTYDTLAALASQLGGAVLVGHSQSGHFPIEAALVDPSGIKGMVLLEPGSCGTYAPEEISKLVDIPILAVYGDHLDSAVGVPGFSWETSFEGCQAVIDQVNQAGGNAEMLYPPDLGIKGNSHMLMMDTNNLEIADMIINWIDEKISTVAP